MKTVLLFAMLVGCSIQQCLAAEEDKDFDKFVEGALIVYSQFKTPSKQESERFYTFIQDRWNKTECSRDCTHVGYVIGRQYAKEKNIEIKAKK